MVEIIARETSTCDLKECVLKFIPEVIGKEIEKAGAYTRPHLSSTYAVLVSEPLRFVSSLPRVMTHPSAEGTKRIPQKVLTLS